MAGVQSHETRVGTAKAQATPALPDGGRHLSRHGPVQGAGHRGRARWPTLVAARVSACGHFSDDLGAYSLPRARFRILRAKTGLPPVLVDAYLHPAVTPLCSGREAAVGGCTHPSCCAPRRFTASRVLAPAPIAVQASVDVVHESGPLVAPIPPISDSRGSPNGKLPRRPDR